ncbi:hypothetical protein [Streptomyces sp. ITFR-6]|uniref:hypothetical protein n=1 Tax=Streptomyces sp. ITFR-6 TaxID=3075197 RepID=UPI002889233B|nr:hypothetical protein [Streptomyces sp. ITFR-6]WNI27506.1 hypothetical protein RLT59_00940 [Streptomyces sp. ITFR-6]
MAWRDRLRRRTAGPDTADRSRATERTGPSGDGRDRGASAGPAPSNGPVPSAGPASSVPGDWDGGWRRTPPPQLTVARAPLGVSDGLAFRDGLAAWQNPSFDAGLGHALLPTAPTGLVRGVTPPAAPQPTRTGRGPLLLRALRTEEPNGPDSVTPQAAAPDTGGADGGTRTPTARTPQISRRTRPGAASSTGTGTVGTGPGPAPAAARAGGDSLASGRSSGGDSPTSGRRSGGDSPAGDSRSGVMLPRTGRGITSADSPATLRPSRSPVQRAVDPATGPVVTPTDTGTGRVASAPHIPLVRRVSVVPGTAAAPALPATGGRASRPPVGASEPHQARASRPTAGSGSRTSSGPAVQRSTTGTPGAQAERGGGQPAASRAPGVERAGGAPREAVRARPVGPLPTVARRPAGPVRRLPALRPASAPATDDRATPDAPGPDSTAPVWAGSGTRSAAPLQRAAGRAPLGAPMSGLPSTAQPLVVDEKVVPPTARTASAPGPALPVVQQRSETTAGPSAPGTPSAPAKRAETPDRTTSGRTTPDRTTSGRRASGRTASDRRTGARARGGLGAPLSELPPTAGLPGAIGSAARPPRTAPGPDIQRAPARQASASGAAPALPTVDGNRAEAKDAPLLGASAENTRGADTPSGGSGPGSSGSDGLGSGKQRPGDSGPAAPAPVVVARTPAPGNASTAHAAGTAITAGTAGTARTADTTGAPPMSTVGAHPFTVARAGAHAAPTPPRTLSLLAARPLSLNTRAPDGVAAAVASRPAGRPVVAARRPGAPAPHRSGSTQPSQGPPATAPATPQIQRAATGSSGARTGSAGRGVRSDGTSEPVQRVPVVRPAPLGRGTAGERGSAGPVQAGATPAGAAPAGRPVPARPLPVTAPQAQALAGRPPGTPAPARAPAGTVPVVRPRSTPPTGPVPPIQRDVTGASDGSVFNGSVPKGSAPESSGSSGSASNGPAPNAAPAKPDSQRSGTTPSATGSGAARPGGLPQGSGAELDELARRLLDPVARLLRTELRRGRDRTGRPYDGRR